MKLLPGELKQLHSVLLTAFPSESSLLLMVRLQLGENLEVVAPGSGLDVRILKLIDWAEASGRLENLLTQAPLDANQAENMLLKTVCEAILTAVRARQGARWFAVEDPLKAHFLHDGRAFVDRTDLRTCLADLNQGTGKRVLVVNGDPISGKSYSLRLIAELAERHGYQLASVDLKDEVVTKFGPDDLVRSIARQMKLENIDSIPAQQSMDSRWVQDLRDWVVGEARTTNQRWWLVLDGFDHRDLPPETQQLIEHLLKQVDTKLPGVRLVLLSYTRPLPREIRRYVLNEQIPPIGRGHLESFFQRLFEESGKTFTDGSVAQAVDTVLGLVPAEDPDRLYYLAEAVETVATTLFPKEVPQ